MGYLSVALATDVTLTWLLKHYYPDSRGVASKASVSVAAFIVAIVFGRAVDALADPLVGYWSDRVRSRLGRRKPFILVGAPLLALMFVLIWTPPVPGESLVNGAYIAIAFALFFFLFTVVVCPYLAMLPEITSSRDERVSLTAWQGAFNVLGAVGGTIASGYLIDHYGYRTMGLCLAPVILVSSWAPLLVPQPAASTRPSGFSLGEALMSTLRNPLFVPYVLAQLLFWIAVRIIIGVMPKLLDVRFQVGETVISTVMATGLLVAALFLPFMPRIVRRTGKKRLLVGSMAYLGLVALPVPFLGRLPLPVSGIGQAFLLMAFAGPAIAVLFTLPNAIVGDIVDRDEERTGERREAMYFGVQGLLVKAGMGLGMGLAAALLRGFGAEVERQGGYFACALAVTVLSLCAAAVMTRYRER
jgi:GPH family glycoside/pentoside/hexuronide:cation symporter